MRFKPHRVRLFVAATLAAGSVLPISATAQQAAEKNVRFASFDHLNTAGDRSYQLHLSDGETFQVRILNTCPDVFSYEIHGIVREEAGSGGVDQRSGGQLKKEHVIPVVHDEKYGGYIVTIKRTLATAPCGDATAKLENRTLMISTPKMSWDLSFSGGFTLSSLNSPHYYLRPHPSEAGQKQIQEDPDKTDDANLGIASYVHLYHHRMPWLAGMFGLGIRDNNKTEYYLGGGLRFSDKATFNLGAVFGPVSRLKDGNNLTDAISDDNVLTDLPSRTRRGFFVGLSYSFIDVRGKLQQPFAGSTGAAGATGKTETGKPAEKAGACAVAFDATEVTLGAAANANATVNLKTTPEGCPWKVTDGVPAWASLTPTEGKGNAALKITATQANSTPKERTSVVDINGVSFTIKQTNK